VTSMHPATSLKATLTGLAACVLGLSTLSWVSAQSSAVRQHAKIASIKEIAYDLSTPWGLSFLPDGSALVSSRNSGEIRRIDPATGRHWQVGIVAGVVARNDSGLLGLAVSPNFAVDGPYLPTLPRLPTIASWHCSFPLIWDRSNRSESCSAGSLPVPGIRAVASLLILRATSG